MKNKIIIALVALLATSILTGCESEPKNNEITKMGEVPYEELHSDDFVSVDPICD